MLWFHKPASDLPFPNDGACDLDIRLEGRTVCHCVIFCLDEDHLLGQDI